MTHGDSFILMIVGAVFLVLGIIGIIWGRHEEKRLLEALVEKRDLRDFVLSHVQNPQPRPLKTGGWIAISLGMVMLLVGVIVWFLEK